MKNKLKNIRTLEYKMNIMEFANILKVNYSTYRGWEKGTSYPPLEIAFKIANILKRRVDDIWQL